ncbi:hypothetical protein FA95DRAFT_1505273 [Auriscalpium vulgare]|uniref:Uncharacterized protein n=1 Tax=Auriscalpium vulgare TaxID=40419 RepID=A0ACB8R4G5_9AGAM|nr:hypothetical protein FA95DRAFT_1505273 [Auriscalpium vulgare]
MSSVGGAAEYLASGPPVRRQPELDLGEDESRAWEGEGLEGVHEEQACLPTPSTKGLPGRVDHPLAPSNRPRLGLRKPPIWAQSRQEVCETLHFFKSYQGGVYHLHEIVKGYLLSAFSASRDVFEHGGKLIISHGGGKSEAVHSKHGQLETHAATDQQADDQSVRALRNTRAQKRPVVLLADDKYALFPYDLAAEGYTYVVLGLYWITDAWAELQETPSGPVKRWKFAFQWCENQGEPWWCIDAQPATEVPCSSVETSEAREQGVTTIESAGYLPDLPIDASCIRCKKTSSHVYSASWICLTPDCHAFWKLDGDHSAGDDLTYEPAFLCLRPQPIKNLKESVMPAPLPTAKNGNATTQRFTKGMHCAKCGRLSSRYAWEHWECKTCQTVYQVHNQLRDPKDFWVQPRNIPFETFKMARDAGASHVKPGRCFQPRAGSTSILIRSYSLPPRPTGRIHLLRPRVFGNKAADEVFRLYQEQASSGEIEFRRWPLRNVSRGQLLSNYFSQNTGAPYQYVGGSDRTVPLDACASCVRGALDLINDRVYGALNRDEPFNEVLSAAYMEKQKMAFHSDSERGLGPVVASLSLGSVAYIHFRLHARYTRDLGNRKIALTIALQHGDVLVMEGAGVQVYYEHTVVPMNFRMVATARYISPDNDTY